MKKLFTVLLLITAFSFAAIAQDQTPRPNGRLTVEVGKSLIMDIPVNIQRVSVANPELATATASTTKEVLVTGKALGETSLVIEQENGNRLLYDLTIRPSPAARLDTIRTQEVQRVEGQVLLRLRFASVDRSAEADLGLNLLSSSAFNQTTAVSGDGQTLPTVTRQPLNIFLVQPDIDVLATIKALQARNALELLADANIMAIDGKQASFVAGGEFPFPTLQGGAGVTIQFREFGVRLNFLPNITPRGTIRLQVAPEVSSLDYANAILIQGFNVPALTTRRVNTEVELESGQSFVIGGLLDNTTTQNLNKIPGIGDIPVLGKLFQSKTVIKGSTELLVIITPEVVRPIPAGKPVPNLKYPTSFLPPNSPGEMRQPGISQTGPVPVRPASDSIRIEELSPDKVKGQTPQNPAMPPFQLVPVPVPQAVPSANPGIPSPPVPQAQANNSGGAR